MFRKITLTIIFSLLISHNCLADNRQIVAISQIVSHKALDEVYKGIIDELKAQGFENNKNIKILYGNAQGNISLAVQIAKQFVSKKPKIMVGIATPSAQTLIKARENKDSSVIFSSVTDPYGAKILPNDNVTGVINVVNYSELFEIIEKILPTVKKIGILANYSDEGSMNALGEIKKISQEKNINIIVYPVSNISEIKGAISKMEEEVEAIILQQDNLVASSVKLVAKRALNSKIPVFSSYVDGINDGILISFAPNEYKIGRQTGQMVAKALRGEQISIIKPQTPISYDFIINRGAAQKLSININCKFKRVAQFID